MFAQLRGKALYVLALFLISVELFPIDLEFLSIEFELSCPAYDLIDLVHGQHVCQPFELVDAVHLLMTDEYTDLLAYSAICFSTFFPIVVEP